MEDMQPGQIIAPTSPGGEQPIHEATVTPVAAEPQQQPMVAPAASQPPQPEPSPEPQPAQEAAPATIPENHSEVPPVAPSAPSAQSQTADMQAALSVAEHMPHEKHGLWYGLYILGTLLLSAIVYLTTKDVLSTGIVFIAILGLIIFASRRPEPQEYTIEGESLRVGQKVYHLHDFKAFSVIQEGATLEVILHPLRRFLPMVSVYVTHEQADALADYLVDFLPFEPHKPDAVDSLLRRIRF